MTGDLTDIERLILSKLDKIDDRLDKAQLRDERKHSAVDEKIANIRISVAKMSVIIALATSTITATVVMIAKDAVALQPAIVQTKEE